MNEGFTAVPNDILEACVRLKLSSYETRIFLTIVRMTFGWQKPDGDTIALRQFTEATGIDRRNVGRAARKLEERQFIWISRNGKNAAHYRVNLNVSDWLLSSLQMTARKRARRVFVVSRDDSLSSPQMTKLSSVEMLSLSSPETPSEETLKEKKERIKESTRATLGSLEASSARSDSEAVKERRELSKLRNEIAINGLCSHDEFQNIKELSLEQLKELYAERLARRETATEAV
jgi:phage replication O-like protein O